MAAVVEANAVEGDREAAVVEAKAVEGEAAVVEAKAVEGECEAAVVEAKAVEGDRGVINVMKCFAVYCDDRIIKARGNSIGGVTSIGELGWVGQKTRAPGRTR